MPHIHEKIDFTVEVFIVHEDKVLLRKHDKLKIWLSVGGHIELDEDPNQAAHREVMEEVGLQVELIGGQKGDYEVESKFFELVPPKFLGRNKYSETHEHIVFVYFGKAKGTDIKAMYENDKSEECRWFTKEELLKEDIVPNVRFYALEALKEIGCTK